MKTTAGRIVLAVALALPVLALPPAAQAGEWLFISNLVEGGSLFYLDTGESFRRGEIATVPVRTANGQKDVLEVNCVRNSIKAQKTGKTIPPSADPAVKTAFNKSCARFFEIWK